MIAIFATLLTALASVLILIVLWFILIRPIVSKTEKVMDVADESFEARMAREQATEEERKRAEAELQAMLGQGEDSGKGDEG